MAKSLQSAAFRAFLVVVRHRNNTKTMGLSINDGMLTVCHLRLVAAG